MSFLQLNRENTLSRMPKLLVYVYLWMEKDKLSNNPVTIKILAEEYFGYFYPH